MLVAVFSTTYLFGSHILFVLVRRATQGSSSRHSDIQQQQNIFIARNPRNSPNGFYPLYQNDRHGNIRSSRSMAMLQLLSGILGMCLQIIHRVPALVLISFGQRHADTVSEPSLLTAPSSDTQGYSANSIANTNSTDTLSRQLWTALSWHRWPYSCLDLSFGFCASLCSGLVGPMAPHLAAKPHCRERRG